MSVALETISRVGLGLPHDSWGMRYAPDLAAPSIMVDFDHVRGVLGIDPDAPFHVFSDLDRTLRVTHGTEIQPDIAAHLRDQLVSGAITSLSITTNSLDADFDRFGPQIHDKVQTFGPRNMGMFKQDKRFFPYIAETLGIAHEPILVVGDKGRRDIVGAHHARLFSMLVSPLGDKDLWFDALGLRKLDDLALRIGSNAVRRRLVLAV